MSEWQHMGTIIRHFCQCHWLWAATVETLGAVGLELAKMLYLYSCGHHELKGPGLWHCCFRAQVSFHGISWWCCTRCTLCTLYVSCTENQWCHTQMLYDIGCQCHQCSMHAGNWLPSVDQSRCFHNGWQPAENSLKTLLSGQFFFLTIVLTYTTFGSRRSLSGSVYELIKTSVRFCHVHFTNFSTGRNCGCGRQA